MFRFHDKALFKLGLSLIALILIVTLSGCGNSSVFKSLAGGGQDQGGVLGAESALENGNYPAAISNADAVINNPEASTEEKQSASLVKGQALLGNANITATKLLLTLEDRPEGTTQNILALLPDMNIDSALLAASSLNFIDFDVDLGSLSVLSIQPKSATASVTLSKNQYMARLMANAIVCGKMLSLVWTITDSGIVVNTDFSISSSLDYLFPPSGRGIAYYSRVVDATAPHCGLSTNNRSLITKIVTTIQNLNAISNARVSGSYTYTDGGVKTINSSSTPSAILAAINYEILKVK